MRGVDNNEPPKPLARVFIVDPHPVVRDGLRVRISSDHSFCVGGEAEDLAEVPTTFDADAYLVDAELADELDFEGFRCGAGPCPCPGMACACL